MIGATWASILIRTLPRQVEKFKGLGEMNEVVGDDSSSENIIFEIGCNINLKSIDDALFIISGIWTICILYLTVFIFNIVLSVTVLHGVRMVRMHYCYHYYY